MERNLFPGFLVIRNTLRNSVVIVALATMSLSLLMGLSITNGNLYPLILVIGVEITLFLLSRKLETVLLFWVLFAMGLQWWNGIELGSGIPNITLDRYILCLGVMSLAMRRTRFKAFRGFPSTVILLMSIYIIYSFFNVILRSENLLVETLTWFSATVFPYVALFLALQIRTEEHWWKNFFNFVPVIVWYLFLPAIFEQVTQITFLPWGVATGFGEGVEGIRSASLAGESTNLSYSVVLLFPLMLYQFTQAKKPIRRILDILTMLALIAMIFINGYRAAWIAVIIISFFALILIAKLRKFLAPFFLVGMIFVLGFSNQLLSSTYVTKRVLDSTSIESRYVILSIQIERIKKNLFFGEGGENAWMVDSYLEGTIASHNTLISILLYHGLVGLILYLGIWVTAFASIVKAWKYSKKRLISPPFIRSYLLFLALLGAILNGLAMDTRFFATNNMLAGFFTGLCIQEADRILRNGSENILLEKTS